MESASRRVRAILSVLRDAEEDQEEGRARRGEIINVKYQQKIVSEDAATAKVRASRASAATSRRVCVVPTATAVVGSEMLPPSSTVDARD